MSGSTSPAPVLAFTAANFAFDYAKGSVDPASVVDPQGRGTNSQVVGRYIQPDGEYGYNTVFGQAQRGLMPADFAPDAALSETIVFGSVGVEQPFRFGTARFWNDYTARPYEADPANPVELDINLLLGFGGTVAAFFRSTPDVKSGVLAGGAADAAARGGRADPNLEGTTASFNTDFRAHFEPVAFVAGGQRFTATLRDIVFDFPNQTPLGEAPVYVPLEIEPIVISVRWDGPAEIA